MHEEQRNVRNLIRFVAFFVAWPALSISAVLFLDFEEHLLHILGLLPLGIAAVVVFIRAPSLARRFVPDARAD
jgi:hypothetical protein